MKIAVLYNEEDAAHSSPLETLEHFQQVAKERGIQVDIISNSDFHLLDNYDALFLRSDGDRDTSAYLFACYMLQEGKPVIDDPLSIIQCTDKVYMQGMLGALGVPLPDSRGVTADTNLETIGNELGFPLVIKLPDSCFSRGVFKVETLNALKDMTNKLFASQALLLAQEYLPTRFDWRVGVLGNEPLFVCKYHMVEGHWQIVKHHSDGTYEESNATLLSLAEAPPEVIEMAVLAASAVGDGLYGVDLKTTTKRGVVVIEVNDNPNIEHEVEDARDEVWHKILTWFQQRLIKDIEQ